MPKSIVLMIARTVWLMMVGPPAAPTDKIGLPSFRTIVGQMLKRGRLPVRIALAWAPSNRKSFVAAGHANLSGQLRRVVFRDEAARDFGKVGIAEPIGAVSEGQFHRFSHHVNKIR